MIVSSLPAAEPPVLPGFELPNEMRQYTYREIATLKRVSVQTVFEWVKRGKIASPIYTGATARFTHDQVLNILAGISPAGTHQPAESLRSDVGKLGVEKKAAKKKATKKKAAKKKTAKKKPTAKLVGDTPAAKKIAARREGGKS